ncbi:MAG: lipoprotein, partial [Proteobacteria bacterium]|nr:lipoprotein [Pseudomonadota bacterium]
MTHSMSYILKRLIFILVLIFLLSGCSLFGIGGK